MKNQTLRAFTEGFTGSFYLAAALIVALVTTVTAFATLDQPTFRKRMCLTPEPDTLRPGKDGN
jgi:hypothetical protein